MIINFLGDSITEGKWAERQEDSYVEVAGRELSATVRCYGVSGTRIAKRRLPYHKEFNEDFNLRCDRMDKNADFVFVFGGTNDFGHGDAPIGEISDDSPYTFMGALNILTDKLIKNYGREKICFILPLHRSNEDDPLGDHVRDFPIGTLADFTAALVSVLDAKNIEYLSFGEIFTRASLPSLTTDGLHPNTEGHRIIGEEIAVYIRQKFKL